MTEGGSNENVALQPGSRLGPYEIVSFLGAGGMGEVYRARDTRLLREVAIKVLPAGVASDRERLKRFEREARAASALNHPNIVTIHEIGTADSRTYIVMELVEGDSVRKLLARGALPIRKVLQIGPQIAEGLARAHEAGIVHRDLKPENVMVGRDGIAKVLDFGLAKTRVRPAGRDETSTPTETATETGAVLGTAGYMSPEQVAGKELDHRSDQFSLGAVLYEMVTGRRAFHGKTSVDTMSSILNEDPQPIVTICPQAPAPLRWIVQRCLAKSLEDRYFSTRDLARDLAIARDRLSDSGSGEPASTTPRRVRPRALAVLAAAVASIVAAYLVGHRRGEGKAPSPVFRQLTFRRGGIQSARFTTDGGTVVFSASWDGEPLRLFSTRIESPGSASLELPAADLAAVSSSAELLVFPGRRFNPLDWPAPSPLARVPMAGGTPRVLDDRVIFADWTPDASSLAAVFRDGAVFRGGRASRRLEFPLGKVLLNGRVFAPRVSRDGRSVAYLTEEPHSVAVTDLAGKTKVLASQLGAVGMYLAWSRSGDEVWFTSSDRRWSASLRAVSLTGRERILVRLPGWINLQDISPDGRVLLSFGKNREGIRCRLPGWEGERDLSWFDFSEFADLSADGSELLFAEIGETALKTTAYLRGTDGSPPQRLGEFFPLKISPDGKWVLALELHGGKKQYLVFPTGPGQAKYLPEKPGLEYFGASAWLPDGRRVLAVLLEGEGRFRTYAVDLEGGNFEPLTPEGFQCSLPSPDGMSALCETGEGRRIYHFERKESIEIAGLENDDDVLGWSDDGEFLFVRPASDVADATRIYRLELETGNRQIWRDLGPLDPAGLVRSELLTGLTPDGGSYCYSAVHLPSDLYLVEGLR